jgi:hypothetical protein
MTFGKASDSPLPTYEQADPGPQGVVRPTAVERHLRRRVDGDPSRQEVDEARVEADRVVSLPLVARGEEHFEEG